MSPDETELEEEAKGLLNWFISSYKSKFDCPYIPRKGERDVTEFKELLQQELRPDDIKLCIDEFMDDDDWNLDRKKTVAMFRTRINTYMQPDEFESHEFASC